MTVKRNQNLEISKRISIEIYEKKRLGMLFLETVI